MAHSEAHAVFTTEFRVKLDILSNLLETLQKGNNHSNAPRIQQVTQAYIDLLQRATLCVNPVEPPPTAVPKPRVPPEEGAANPFEGYTLKAIRNFSPWDWKTLRVMSSKMHRGLISHWLEQGALAALYYAQTAMNYNWLGCVMEGTGCPSLLTNMLQPAWEQKQWHTLLYVVHVASTMEYSSDGVREIIRMSLPKKETLLRNMDCPLRNPEKAIQRYAQIHDPDAADWGSFTVDAIFSLSSVPNDGDDEIPELEVNMKDAFFTQLKISSLQQLQAIPADQWKQVEHFTYDQHQSLLEHWARRGALGALHYVQTHAQYSLLTIVFSPNPNHGQLDVIKAATERKQWHVLFYMINKVPMERQSLFPTRQQLVRNMKEESSLSIEYEAMLWYIESHDCDTYTNIEWKVTPIASLSDNLHGYREEEEGKTTEDVFPAPVSILSERPLSELRDRIEEWSTWMKEKACFLDLFELLLRLIKQNKLSVLDLIQSVAQFDLLGAIFSDASETQIEMIVEKVCTSGRWHLALYMTHLLCKPYSSHFPSIPQLVKTIIHEHQGADNYRAILLSCAITSDPYYESWISHTDCLQRLLK